MPYSTVSGDLLDADTEFIVQQTCCTACRPHGLSAAIAAKWPDADPYSSREHFKGNWAVVASRPAPGTIAVFAAPGRPSVVCAFAQYTHGKPGAYRDPLAAAVPDDFEARFRYFRSCLDALADLKPSSVGFPFRIGCGLAGGSWPRYERALKAWSLAHPTVDVRVYAL